MQLFGREWSRREIEARVGRIEQIGGVERVDAAAAGRAAGSQLALVRTGAGLEYVVNLSKGLDIGRASLGGTPLAWVAPGGDTHPSYFEPQGYGWLRSAGGGLVMTCGMNHSGVPIEHDLFPMGIHGRAHHTPAEHVSTVGRWDGDEYLIEVAATMSQSAIFGERVSWRRVIRSRLGRNTIELEDTVRNDGFKPEPIMLIYHCNFGFPLLGPDTRVQINSTSVVERDQTPADDPELSAAARWAEPDPDRSERVFYHAFDGDPSITPGASLVHPRFPMPTGERAVRATLGWSADTLPVLMQWWMPGCGEHVMGLEPSTCRVGLPECDPANGDPPMLEPGETRRFSLQFGVTLAVTP